MAKRRGRTGPGAEHARVPVRWSDGTVGEVVRACVSGDVLRLDLTRGPDAVAAEMTQLAPDFYAGTWVVTGFQAAQGSANATLT